MGTFVCRYGTPGGAIQTEQREADTAQALRQELEERGLYVFGVSPAATGRLPRLGLSLPTALPRRVTLKDLLLFNQEFHALVRAGLPIVQALDVLVRQCANPRLREALVAVRQDVTGGLAFSDAAAKHPRLFSHLYVASLRAGERSGTFVECLGRYLVLVRRLLSVRKKLLAALTYPAILVLLSGAVVTFLLSYVVPIFTRMYANFDAALPTPTLVLIQVTGLARDLALPLVVLLVLAGMGLQRWARTPSGRRRLDGVLLALPSVGELIRRYSASLFCRTLATLLGGGLPIIGSLETAARSLVNTAVRERLLAAIPAVSAGSGLGAALERTGLVPATALEMITVGESAGSLPEMLGHVADFFDEEIDMRLQSLTAVIEPLIMVVMGLFVGTIVVVMYLPIFELSRAIR